jgi:hypothetical protein
MICTTQVNQQEVDAWCLSCLEAMQQIGFGDGGWVGVARGWRGFGGHCERGCLRRKERESATV